MSNKQNESLLNVTTQQAFTDRKELLRDVTLAEKQIANGKKIARETVKKRFLKGKIVR
ncbi:MAG: hypothetical protein WC209_03050 [Ignavibacteriaceae bacterium]